MQTNLERYNWLYHRWHRTFDYWWEICYSCALARASTFIIAYILTLPIRRSHPELLTYRYYPYQSKKILKDAKIITETIQIFLHLPVNRPSGFSSFYNDHQMWNVFYLNLSISWPQKRQHSLYQTTYQHWASESHPREKFSVPQLFQFWCN